MRRQFLQQLRQAGLIPPGARLLVALSGGVDSVVLLHLLRGAVDEFGWELSAAHLDHSIRPQGREDALFVAELCEEWGIPLRVERSDVPGRARRQGISVEMAGRQARREFLQRTAAGCGAELIALGHHRDDQAETFLLRLLRGSGCSGLAAMRPRVDCWVRPLLDFSREQLLDHARQEGLVWVEDASNLDPRYLRNRVRHQLLPQLRQVNPRIGERLAALCEQLRGEEDYWAQQVALLLPELIVDRADGLRLCCRGLSEQHPALRRRLLREAIRRVRGDLQRLEGKHLLAIEQLLSGQRSQSQLDLPGLWAARRYRQLWLRPEPPAAPEPFCLTLSVPGTLTLPDGRLLRAEFMTRAEGEGEGRAEFDADLVDFPLQVRSFRDGDRFSPAGGGGSKKLKDFFIDQKLELEQRHRLPLVTSGGEILWLSGLRRSDHAPVTQKTALVLRLQILPEGLAEG